jgi:hypothetical protein
MFAFIAPSFILAPIIVDCATIDTKCLADELEWNARSLFLAQNLTCMQALLAERCCRYKIPILLQALNDLGAGRDSDILAECPGQVSLFNK